ncbi:MAG: hypothetical protein IPJ40_10130 [Saprospirales bacterium]|nr:hypothetical protein [Saprospirales bacterium]
MDTSYCARHSSERSEELRRAQPAEAKAKEGLNWMLTPTFPRRLTGRITLSRSPTVPAVA